MKTLLATSALRVTEDDSVTVLEAPWKLDILLMAGIAAGAPLLLLLGRSEHGAEKLLFLGVGGLLAVALPVLLVTTLRRARRIVFDRRTGIVTLGARELLPGQLTRLWVESPLAPFGSILLAEIDGKRTVLTRPVAGADGQKLEQIAASLGRFTTGRVLDPTPAPTPLQRGAARAVGSALRFNRAYGRFRFGLAAWSVRILWPACALWAGWDAIRVARGGLSPEELDRTYGEIAIRGGAAIVLLLLWIFLFRRRGAFTANRGGRLEK